MTHPQTNAEAKSALPQVMLGGYLFFLLLGAAGTLYGPGLVYLAAEAKQSVGNLGIIFVLHWSGYFASTFFVNWLARRLGMRRAVTAGIGCVALGALGLALLPFPLNLAPTVLIGFGLGTEILLNRAVEFLAVNSPAAALTRLHATVGLGSVIMPLLVTGIIGLGMSWRIAALAVTAMALLVAFITARWRDFDVPHGDDIVWRTFPWSSVVVLMIIIILQVGVETAIGGWVTTFFVQSGSGALWGALATSLFFLTFTFGRIFLAAIPERWGYGRTVQFACAVSVLGLLLTFSAAVAFAGFALAGIALSVIFPTLLAWVARRHTAIRAQMASISIAAAGAGGIIVPYAVGLGVGQFGAWALPVILIILIVGMGWLAGLEPAPQPTAPADQPRPAQH